MPTCMTTVQPHWLTPATITMAVLAAEDTHVDDAFWRQEVPPDAHQVIVVAAATSAQILPFFQHFEASCCVEERARYRTAGTDGDQHQVCPPFWILLPVYRRDPPWNQVRSIAAHASVKKNIVQKAPPRGAAVPPRRRLSVAPATEHGAGPALAASRSGVRAR